MRRLAAWLAFICLALFWAQAAPAGEPVSGRGPVWVIDLKDTINPGSTDFLLRGIAKANKDDAALVVIKLDTPGGVADSMRRMAQAIMESKAPVAVYVAPPGARATSAGAFLVLAANVGAMAPATHLGAASPVTAGGKDIEGTMAKKAKSDLGALIQSLAKRRGRDPKAALEMVTEAKSYDAVQAKEMGMVDVIAPDLGSLLKALEGRVVETAGGQRRITSKGRGLHFFKPGMRDKLLSALASPNLAYILLMIGMAGIYFELSHPGVILPGVVGALSLILAFFAMSALPVSYAGLALIGLAIVLFIAEIKVTSYGMLSVGGAISLFLGSIMLFKSGDQFSAVSLSVLLPVGGSTMVFFAGVAFLAGRAQFAKKQTGMEGLVGERGVVIGPGKVRVMGEIWQATGTEGAEPGEPVEVMEVAGLVVRVGPVSKQGQAGDRG